MDATARFLSTLENHHFVMTSASVSADALPGRRVAIMPGFNAPGACQVHKVPLSCIRCSCHSVCWLK